MFTYQDARDDEAFEYGVVTYFDGEDDAVTAEGYVRGATLGGTDEPIVVVVEPDETVQLPFDRVVKIRYEMDDS
ncbi:hypothetical protein [Halorussus halophilus]|uniref:hypothetical protein n=1 Tax=Halorussus halophilus TaxID=2650975 RepID=UPI001300FCEB|nr:hypothetical protein [Halorussus halophilus]